MSATIFFFQDQDDYRLNYLRGNYLKGGKWRNQGRKPFDNKDDQYGFTDFFSITHVHKFLDKVAIYFDFVIF